MFFSCHEIEEKLNSNSNLVIMTSQFIFCSLPCKHCGMLIYEMNRGSIRLVFSSSFFFIFGDRAEFSKGLSFQL